MQLKPRDFSLQEAAGHLGITRFSLVLLLENHGLIQQDRQHGPAPTPAALARGLLRINQRSHSANGLPTRYYQCARVTIQGLAWIEKTAQPPIATAA